MAGRLAAECGAPRLLGGDHQVGRHRASITSVRQTGVGRAEDGRQERGGGGDQGARLGGHRQRRVPRPKVLHIVITNNVLKNEK